MRLLLGNVSTAQFCMMADVICGLIKNKLGTMHRLHILSNL